MIPLAQTALTFAVNTPEDHRLSGLNLLLSEALPHFSH
jgi:hypothetical protein